MKLSKQFLAKDIVSVKPMYSPTGSIFYMDYFYTKTLEGFLDKLKRRNMDDITTINARIISRLEKYDIDINKCTIHSDGTVDVDDDVNLQEFKNENYINVRFGKTKSFHCPPDIVHYINCPRYVDGDFIGAEHGILFQDGLPDDITGSVSIFSMVSIKGITVTINDTDSDYARENNMWEYMYALIDSPDPAKSMRWLRDGNIDMYTQLYDFFTTYAKNNNDVFQFGIECEIFSEDVVNISNVAIQSNHKLG